MSASTTPTLRTDTTFFRQDESTLPGHFIAGGEERHVQVAGFSYLIAANAQLTQSMPPRLPRRGPDKTQTDDAIIRAVAAAGRLEDDPGHRPAVRYLTPVMEHTDQVAGSTPMAVEELNLDPGRSRTVCIAHDRPTILVERS